MLLADRFATTVAPASTAKLDGGTGTQTSSQISTASANPSRSVASKIRSGPKGTTSPKRDTSRRTAARAGAN